MTEAQKPIETGEPQFPSPVPTVSEPPIQPVPVVESAAVGSSQRPGSPLLSPPSATGSPPSPSEVQTGETRQSLPPKPEGSTALLDTIPSALGEGPQPRKSDGPVTAQAEPGSIAVVETDLTKLPEKEESVELLFGEAKKSSKPSIPVSNRTETLKVPDDATSEVLSSVDYSVQTAAYTGYEEPAVVEKQPVIGQLQLKELLSGTSMKIVEYAQKLAETPLIGTIQEDPLPPAAVTQGPAIRSAPSRVPLVPSEVVDKKSTLAQLSVTEDRFPGPDHDEVPRGRQSHLNTLIVQEDETADTEPYEAYSFPEGCDKADEVPAIIRKYVQAFQDDKQPIAKVFKLEDEDKLNEAAGWDIQPSFRPKPECVIRCSIIKKILKGILQFRLSKAPLEFDGRQPKMIMQILSEDTATTLSQLRFPSYKYGYFVTLIQKNHQDVTVSTRQLWDPETDRRVIARFESRQLHASIIVHFIFHP